ncbi:MAG: hypothetical protein JXQ27_14515 [Acidobacteria bacterium]|nr:hypothetical protein [Acidobacteriota bacterium]
MNVKPIHRNLQHVPRIWGVSYGKLFASLFAMLLMLMVCFYTVANSGLALAAGLATGLAGYGISFWLDSRDPLARSGPGLFIRPRLTALSLSNQTYRIRHHATL